MISPVGMSWILNSIMVLVLFLQASPWRFSSQCCASSVRSMGRKSPPVMKRSQRNFVLTWWKSNQWPFSLTTNPAEWCIFEMNVRTNAYLLGNLSLPDTEMEKQNAAFGALDHQCWGDVELRCYLRQWRESL